MEIKNPMWNSSSWTFCQLHNLDVGLNALIYTKLKKAAWASSRDLSSASLGWCETRHPVSLCPSQLCSQQELTAAAVLEMDIPARLQSDSSVEKTCREWDCIRTGMSGRGFTSAMARTDQLRLNSAHTVGNKTCRMEMEEILPNTHCSKDSFSGTCWSSLRFF